MKTALLGFSSARVDPVQFGLVRAKLAFFSADLGIDWFDFLPLIILLSVFNGKYNHNNYYARNISPKDPQLSESCLRTN